MTDDRLKSLAKTLLGYKVSYYAGKPVVSDAVYDKLEDELRAMDPLHPILSVVGAGKEGKVPHRPPMLSMKKTYIAEDVTAYLASHDLVMTPKADGSSQSIEYAVVDGVAVVGRASTRGNGVKGDDNTAKIKQTKVPKTFIVPTRIMTLSPATVEMRGELVFPVERFKNYSHEFDSIRNAVAGVMNRKDPRRAPDGGVSHAIDEISFLCYDLIAKDKNGNILSPYQTFEDLLADVAAIFTVPEYSVIERGRGQGEVDALIEVFFKKEHTYLVDGIVYRVNNMKAWTELGATSHHNNGSLAFKRAGETAETTIRQIEEAVGRTGKVSFTAVFDEVEISGAVLRRATLHNAEFIEAGGYGVGAKIRVIRSGEVIPYVQELIADPSAPYLTPSSCDCGQTLVRRGPDVFCDNKKCSQREKAYAEYFLKTLEVKGVAEATVDALFSAGLVRRVGDFFRLKEADLLGLDGFKAKSAANVIKAIEARREIDLDTFLSLLGIAGVGRSKGAELAKIFRTMERVRSLSEKDLLTLDGWAGKTAAAFVEGLVEREDMVNDLLGVMTVKDMAAEDLVETAGRLPLAGVTVVITGSLSRPRADLEKDLAAAGARVAGSVTRNTTYLVTNEASGSSKAKRAAELGVPVMTEAEIMAKAAG